MHYPTYVSIQQSGIHEVINHLETMHHVTTDDGIFNWTRDHWPSLTDP